MRAVVTCKLLTTRFFITAEGRASDIPARAGAFRDLTDAALIAGRLRPIDGLPWEPGYLMADGSLALTTA